MNYRATDAYAAGLIDGEGYIGIARRNGAGQFTLRVDVGMTVKAKALLEELKERYGGHVTLSRKATERWEAAYAWRIHGSQAATFLRQVSPYLRLKAEQARLALKVEEIRLSLKQEGGQRSQWTEEARERCAVLKERIHELNRKGPEPQLNPGMGMPIARLVAGQWVTFQSDLFSDLGWQPFSGTWPKSGSMRSGHVYERPTSAPPTSGSGGSASPGLPTPTARDGKGTGFEGQLPNVIELLPTPTTSESTGVGDLAGNRNDTLRARVALLPTPRASAQENRQTKRSPTQKAGKHGLCLAAEVSELNQASAVTQLLPTPRASDTGTPGRRASEGFRPPLSQVLLPTPTATPYGNNQSPSPGAAVRPSLDSLASSGALTDPPSTAGSTSSDAPHPVQLTIEDALTPDSSNG